MNRDAGLQPERTALAWNRTALAAAACSLLLLNSAARHGWGSAVVPAVCTAAVSASLVLFGRRRPNGTHPLAFMLISALVSIACVSGASLVWPSP
ncbi:DUF202 domain-containing protein [Lentzea sp. NPDC102401]|uniref:DUF202 domain-containing protein n=1 Tax=Lentzea sp. NPDC102401 TaxID=3364128 RepID=UPI00382DAA10